MKKLKKWINTIISGILILISIYIILSDFSLIIKILALAVSYISYQAIRDY